MAKKKTDNIVDKVENTAEALEIDLQTKRMVLEEGTVYSGTLNSIVRGLC